MTLAGALEKLQAFGLPVLRTTDAAAHLAVSPANAPRIAAKVGASAPATPSDSTVTCSAGNGTGASVVR